MKKRRLFTQLALITTLGFCLTSCGETKDSSNPDSTVVEPGDYQPKAVASPDWMHRQVVSYYSVQNSYDKTKGYGVKLTIEFDISAIADPENPKEDGMKATVKTIKFENMDEKTPLQTSSWNGDNGALAALNGEITKYNGKTMEEMVTLFANVKADINKDELTNSDMFLVTGATQTTQRLVNAIKLGVDGYAVMIKNWGK